MPIPANYQVFCQTVIMKPFWQGDPAAAAFWGLMGAQLDAQGDALAQARAVAWPLGPVVGSSDPASPDYFPPYSTPTDALQYLAAERQTERAQLAGTAGGQEAEALWRQRLQGAWLAWGLGGSQQAHLTMLGWSGLQNVQVVRRHEWSSPSPTGSVYVQSFARAVWAQFDVYIGQPHGWSQKVWGVGNWGVGYWGSDMTPAQLAYFVRQIRLRKAAEDTCTYLHLSFVAGRVWGLGRWGDGGVWGGTGGVVSYVCGEAHWSVRGLL